MFILIVSNPIKITLFLWLELSNIIKGHWVQEVLVKIRSVTAEILLILTNVAGTNVAWTNVTMRVVTC